MWFGQRDDDDLDLVVGAQRLDVGVLARDVVAVAERVRALGAAGVVGDDVRAGDVPQPVHVELGDEARAEQAEVDWLMMSVGHRSSCVDRLQPRGATGGMSRVERTSEPARGARPAALVTGAGGGIGGAVAMVLTAAGYAVLAVDRDVAGVPVGERHRADLSRRRRGGRRGGRGGRAVRPAGRRRVRARRLRARRSATGRSTSAPRPAGTPRSSSTCAACSWSAVTRCRCCGRPAAERS